MPKNLSSSCVLIPKYTLISEIDKMLSLALWSVHIRAFWLLNPVGHGTFWDPTSLFVAPKQERLWAGRVAGLVLGS